MKMFTKTLIASLLLGTAVQAQAAGDAKHFPGVFVGATHAKSETDFTFGFEYEYKFDKKWGVGAVFERTNDAHKGDGVSVSLASLYYHPWRDLRLGAGIGRERIGGAHPHSEDLYRLSASYEFHVGSGAVAPTIAVDFVDGKEIWVAGFAFIKPF